MNDESDQNTPDRAYRVGRGKPPLHSRFKKGQSGNPSGRPKGLRPLKQDVEIVLAKSLTATENGRRVKITKQRAWVTSLVNKAIKGDVPAITRLIALIQSFAPPQGGEAARKTPLAEADRAILDGYLASLRDEEAEDDGHDDA